MIDIFIKVLDVNNSKKIDPEEFQGIITQRSFYGAGEDSSLSKPFLGIKDNFFHWLNKGERIWNIIVEWGRFY